MTSSGQREVGHGGKALGCSDLKHLSALRHNSFLPARCTKVFF